MRRSNNAVAVSKKTENRGKDGSALAAGEFNLKEPSGGPASEYAADAGSFNTGRKRQTRAQNKNIAPRGRGQKEAGRAYENRQHAARLRRSSQRSIKPILTRPPSD